MTGTQVGQMTFVLLLIFFALCAIHLVNATTDDAFITFRYATNEAHGEGVVFNPGERVEGYSNFLFAQILSLLIASGLTGFPHGLLIWAKALGLVSGLLCVIVVQKAASLTNPGRNLPLVVAMLSSILLCTSPQFIAWTVGGLETSFCALLVALAQFFNIRVILSQKDAQGDYSRLYVLAGFFYLLASLTRPEIPILFAAAFLTTVVHFIRQRRRLSSLLPGLAVYLVPYAGFITWRYYYYGDIFPNTFYAKATGGGEAQLADGLRYFGFGIATVLGPLLLLCLVPLLIRRKITETSSKGGELCGPNANAIGTAGRDRRPTSRQARQAYWFLMWQLVAMSIFIIYCGGDWMGRYRLFVPVMPALVLMAQIGATLLWMKFDTAGRGETARRRWSVAMIIIIVGVFAYHIADVMLVAEKPSGLVCRDLLNREYYAVAKMMHQRIPPNATVALGEAGLIPYYSRVRVIDMRGLTDRYIAHLKGKAHAKFKPMYVFHRKPDYILLVDVTGRTWCEHNYENMLLDHKVLYDDYTLVEAPDMLDAFYKYHFYLYRRKDAPRLTPNG